MTFLLDKPLIRDTHSSAGGALPLAHGIPSLVEVRTMAKKKKATKKKTKKKKAKKKAAKKKK